jgi:hypothetical protein
MANGKRLIDANEALRMIENSRTDNPYFNGKTTLIWEKAHVCALSCVIGCPTVDAVEVVHAHWEDGWGEDCYGNIAYKSIDCSNCTEIFKIESRDREYWKNRFKVCPFCGAQMDGGNEDV